MKHYFNTTGLSGTELLLSNQKAEKQEEIILGLFRRFEKFQLTPFQINDLLIREGRHYPITSIRRAITNLTKAGKLIKGHQADVKGIYQAKNHRWQYNARQEAAA